jgi:hypothetical protein
MTIRFSAVSRPRAIWHMLTVAAWSSPSRRPVDRLKRGRATKKTELKPRLSMRLPYRRQTVMTTVPFCVLYRHALRVSNLLQRIAAIDYWLQSARLTRLFEHAR